MKSVTGMLMVLLAAGWMLISCTEGYVIADGGSATDVGNPTISGAVKDTTGPAAGVLVTLYPDYFNPVTDAVPDSLRDITDAEGEYLFNLTEPGIYNIQALHPESRTGALIQGVEAPDAADTVVTVPDASLQPPGTMTIHIKELTVEENGHVYIQGTGINAQITGSDMNNGFVTVEELPPSAYSAINYTAPGGSAEILPIEEEINVQPGDTLEIGPLTAADFTVVDLFGKEHHLYEYTSAGKYVLIEWTYWCGDLPSYLYMNELWETYGCNSGGLIVLGISGNGTDADYRMTDCAIDNDLNFPVVSGKEGGGYAADTEYEIKGWPTFTLVNPENRKQEWKGWKPFRDEGSPIMLTALSEAGITEKSCPDDGSRRLWVSKGTPSGDYQPGEVITVEWAQLDYKSFTNWTGDTEFMSDPTSTPTTLTMPDRDVTVYAQFSYDTDGILMPRGTGNLVRVKDTIKFYDDRGANLKYSENFTGEITFLPDIPNHKIKMEFLVFALQDTFYKSETLDLIFDEWDTLSIFDGNSTAAPLIGHYWGKNSPGIIESSAEDGSLTVKFVSLSGWIFSGWNVRITLVPTGLIPLKVE